MHPSEISARMERFQALQSELVDPLTAIAAFNTKMAMLPNRDQRADAVKEAVRILAPMMKLYRNHADDYLRAGNLMRRVADTIEPALEEMAKP